MRLPQPQQAVRSRTPALPLLLQAMVVMHAEHPERSIAPLQQALAIEPASAFVYEKLTIAYLASDRVGQAEGALARGLRQAPGDPGLNLLAGQLALEARRFGDAIVALRQSMLDNTLVTTAAPLYVEALLWQGNVRQAHATCRELLHSRPADANLALTLAGILKTTSSFPWRRKPTGTPAPSVPRNVKPRLGRYASNSCSAIAPVRCVLCYLFWRTIPTK